MLPAEVVGPLLTSVPAAFRAGVNDVLLTALAVALRCWRERRGLGDPAAVLIDLEGHGREELTADLDVSRTVGWFTSTYPVALRPGTSDPTNGPALSQALKAVKEDLRRLPDHGLGYGLLRHLNPHTQTELRPARTPQIGFNYLGRFTAPGTDETPWTPAPEFGVIGSGADPGMPLGHALELNALTEDHPEGPRLITHWSWPSELFTESEVHELAALFSQALHTLANPTTHPGTLTPSDLPLISISQPEIEQLETHWNHSGITDLLPLSPLQDGLLFHALYDQHTPESPGTQSYFVQLVVDLEGPLDPRLLRAAGQGLIDRHDNLRAAFVPLASGQTVQLIPRRTELPWDEVDLGEVPADRQQDELARMTTRTGCARSI